MFVSPFRAALHVALLALVFAPAAASADFPDVTDAERQLTTLPSDPSAPAVVLFEKAHCQLLDYPREIISRLEVQVRIKILTEEGKELFGEVAIAHSRAHRLRGFSGRTVLPDGRVVPVGDDAIFRDTTSRSQRQFVTKAAFPALEVGAILDYRYTLVWDNFFNLDPWYFANSVPTLHSEIAYLVPPSLAAEPWGREVNGVKLAVETERQAQGTLMRVTAKNVPAIPDEPDSFPFGDLSSRFMLVPTKVVFAGGELELMASWDAVCDIMERGYKELRQGKRRVRRQGNELAKGLSGGERTRAIYRFLRDEVQTAASYGIFPNEGTLDRALKDGSASLIEKSLMLIEMLDAIGVDSDLVWAANRLDGRVDTDLANPAWFERPLVRVIEDGAPVFLDPSDPRLGYGQLLPGFEGMAAVVYDTRKPEVIELPSNGADDHQRHATLQLAIDEEGRVSGRGHFRATGHHSWTMRLIGAMDDGWQTWLEGRFDGYDVAEIEVTDDREGHAIEATWTMTMRDEEVLGDEVSLQPSRPFGPLTQRYTLPHEQRQTPVQLLFADVDRIDLVATWPEGWVVEVAPEPVSADGPVGDVEVTVAIDEAARRLTYGRLLRIDQVEFAAGGEYEALRRTMAAMERGDAQDLVLVAE